MYYSQKQALPTYTSATSPIPKTRNDDALGRKIHKQELWITKGDRQSLHSIYCIRLPIGFP